MKKVLMLALALIVNACGSTRPEPIAPAQAGMELEADGCIKGGKDHKCDHCSRKPTTVECAQWCVLVNWDFARPEPDKTRCEQLKQTQPTIDDMQDRDVCDRLERGLPKSPTRIKISN